MYDKRFAAQIILSRTCIFSACLTCMWLKYDSPIPTTDESLVVYTSKKNLLQPFDKISISTKSFVFARLNIDNNVN